MGFFRRPALDRLDPARYSSAREWVYMMLDAGLPTDEVRARLDEQLRRQGELHAAAERDTKRHDFADRTRDGRMAATERLLSEVGLDDEFVVPTLQRPSDEIAAGRFPWAY